MAFNIHWQIKFKSLRAGTDYTLNIYDEDYPGSPLKIEGVDGTFSTEETNDEDVLTPLCTQTGTIRIVDTGTLWQDIAPINDLERPVTLTDGQDNVCWQGFIQSQNFGTTLYGNPQECEFPVQCPLSAVASTDIITTNSNVTELKSMAYYMKRILDYIKTVSGNIITFDYLYVQGLSSTNNQLLTLIDPQVFVDIDTTENTMSAKYKMNEVMEDLCRYWGFSLHLQGKSIYLLNEVNGGNFTKIDINNLETMTGTTVSRDSVIIGNQFASTGSDISIMRGYSRATVKGDAGNVDSEIIKCYPQYISKQIYNTFPYPDQERFEGSDNYVIYDGGVSSFTSIDMVGEAAGGVLVFRNGRYNPNGTLMTGNNTSGLLWFPDTQYNGNVRATIRTVYEHNYAGRYLEMNGETYSYGDKLEFSEDGNEYGTKVMKIALGIGKSESSAKWYNGTSWGSTQSIFEVTIGNSGNTMYVRANDKYRSRIGVPLEAGFVGRLFVKFYGTADATREQYSINGDVRRYYNFTIKDFKISHGQHQGSITADGDPVVLWEEPSENSKEAIADNVNIAGDEINVDCIFCSWGAIRYGYGIIANANGTPYGLQQEQTLAYKICGTSGYWESSRHSYYLELLSNDASVRGITPMHKVTIDGNTCTVLSINRDWQNDIIQLTLIEQ